MIPGLLESVASEVGTSASESIMSAVSDFALGESHGAACLVRAEDVTHVQVFDAIYVIMIPLRQFQMGALTQKLMHSVVILLNQATGVGCMLEYTSGNSVTVSLPGRIATKTGLLASHRPNKHFTRGFLPCRITWDQLMAFNLRFQELSDYQLTAHNCHIYHRSLVYTAIHGGERMYYNVQGKLSVWTALRASKRWVELLPGMRCRADVLASKNRAICNLSTILPRKACNIIPVTYHPDRHHIISIKGMRMTVEEMGRRMSEEQAAAAAAEEELRRRQAEEEQQEEARRKALSAQRATVAAEEGRRRRERTQAQALRAHRQAANRMAAEEAQRRTERIEQARAAAVAAHAEIAREGARGVVVNILHDAAAAAWEEEIHEADVAQVPAELLLPLQEPHEAMDGGEEDEVVPETVPLLPAPRPVVAHPAPSAGQKNAPAPNAAGKGSGTSSVLFGAVTLAAGAVGAVGFAAGAVAAAGAVGIIGTAGVVASYMGLLG